MSRDGGYAGLAGLQVGPAGCEHRANVFRDRRDGLWDEAGNDPSQRCPCSVDNGLACQCTLGDPASVPLEASLRAVWQHGRS